MSAACGAMSVRISSAVKVYLSIPCCCNRKSSSWQDDKLVAKWSMNYLSYHELSIYQLAINYEPINIIRFSCIGSTRAALCTLWSMQGREKEREKGSQTLMLSPKEWNLLLWYYVKLCFQMLPNLLNAAYTHIYPCVSGCLSHPHPDLPPHVPVQSAPVLAPRKVQKL